MKYKDSDILSIIKKVRKHNHDNNASIAISVDQHQITLKGHKSILNLDLHSLDENQLSDALNTMDNQTNSIINIPSDTSVTLESLNNKLDHIIKLLKRNKNIRLKF